MQIQRPVSLLLADFRKIQFSQGISSFPVYLGFLHCTFCIKPFWCSKLLRVENCVTDLSTTSQSTKQLMEPVLKFSGTCFGSPFYFFIIFSSRHPSQVLTIFCHTVLSSSHPCEFLGEEFQLGKSQTESILIPPDMLNMQNQVCLLDM